MTYPKINLRLFMGNIDGPRIAQWIMDHDYATFFRNNSILPTYEECAAYPTWSQNLVMMVDDIKHQTIGMVIGYQSSYRNRTIKAGALIDKHIQGAGFGHAAQCTWIEFLFKRLGFRKVIVENIEERFTEPYFKVGFQLEGRHKAEAMVDGVWTDEIRMACFQEDWPGLEVVLSDQRKTA